MAPVHGQAVHGHGIAGMRERAAALDDVLIAAGVEGEGFAGHAGIPVTEPSP